MSESYNGSSIVNKISLFDFVMEDIPTQDALLLVDALFFSVYGWTPQKVRKIKINQISKWVGFAKKRMTWGDAYKLRKLLEQEPKKVSIWKKIYLKIKH